MREFSELNYKKSSEIYINENQFVLYFKQILSSHHDIGKFLEFFDHTTHYDFYKIKKLLQSYFCCYFLMG